VFRYSLIDVENGEALGVVAFAVPGFRPGDLIPQGTGRTLRVVKVLEPHEEGPDRIPLLAVELAD
jgi:hypothetical protein